MPSSVMPVAYAPFKAVDTYMRMYACTSIPVYVHCVCVCVCACVRAWAFVDVGVWVGVYTYVRT